MKLKVFEDLNEFIEESTNFIAEVTKKDKETIRISLSGGSTPKPIYQSLVSRKDIPFSNVEFYIVDERYVPFEHDDSNFKIINKSLISAVKNNIKGFYFFDTSLSIEDCIKKYSQSLEIINTDSFDLTILGMGPDGHIASLFPHSESLKEEKKFALHTTSNEFAVKNRLTITLPLILKSKKILLLLKGSLKEKILDKLLNSDMTIEELPAKALLKHEDLTIHFYNK